MGPLVVVATDEVVKLGLLLQEVVGSGFGGFPAFKSVVARQASIHPYLDMIGFGRGLYGSAVAFKIGLNVKRAEQMAPGIGAHRNSGKEWSELV